jgi:hypothetical protein
MESERADSVDVGGRLRRRRVPLFFGYGAVHRHEDHRHGEDEKVDSELVLCSVQQNCDGQGAQKPHGTDPHRPRDQKHERGGGLDDAEQRNMCLRSMTRDVRTEDGLEASEQETEA